MMGVYNWKLLNLRRRMPLPLGLGANKANPAKGGLCFPGERLQERLG